MRGAVRAGRAPQTLAMSDSLDSGMRERYHATLGYVHATIEQQSAQIAQHKKDEEGKGHG